MQLPKAIRILIVDDNFLFRIGLASTLRMHPEFAVVAEAGTGSAALELYRQHLPDLVLMDWRLPDLDGIETTRALHREFPAAKVIIVSSYEAAGELPRALQAGVQGFVLKDTLDNELLRAIRAVAAGGNYLATELSGCPGNPQAAVKPASSREAALPVRVVPSTPRDA